MKENSKVTDTNVGDIEENIEELKRLLYRDELTQYGKRKLINYYEKQIEKLQKENEEWQKAYQEEKDKQFELIQNNNNTIKTANIAIKDLQEKLKEVISIKKVKDKIEELQNGSLKINENNKYYYETEAYNKIIIQVLQELLESED